MEEIEVKILEVNHEDLHSTLVSMGAKKEFDNEFYTIFFDTEDKKIQNSKEVFRLRKEGDKTFITHKKRLPSKNTKKCEETELEVEDFQEARKLITSLGYKETDKIRKRRVSYKLDDVKFEFDNFYDDYNFVPEFLEIEAKDLDTLYEYVEKLGFSKEDCRSWTGKDVIEHYS